MKDKAQEEADRLVESDFYADGIDHSNLESNIHDHPDHQYCVSCWGENVTITQDKDICHDCGYVYE